MLSISTSASEIDQHAPQIACRQVQRLFVPKDIAGQSQDHCIHPSKDVQGCPMMLEVILSGALLVSYQTIFPHHDTAHLTEGWVMS